MVLYMFQQYKAEIHFIIVSNFHLIWCFILTFVIAVENNVFVINVILMCVGGII